MKSIRAIIVDDEFLGRGRIKKLLLENDQIQIVGEGKNGDDAINLIRDYKPDLAFLDIEMPLKSGLQVVRQLPEKDRPFIVFVTAHDRFAIKAFDVNATDFVLKPFDDARFNKALNQAVHQIELHQQGRLNDRLLQLMDDYKSENLAQPFVINVKVRGVDKRVNLYDVHYIEADGNYLRLQLENERFLVRNTMHQMNDELDHSCFLRIHRSVILNTNYLQGKSYKGNNEFQFKMRNGETFVSGRSFKESIDAYFEEIGA
ncbi:LytTR family DNA-binding domain-containing protein [Salibacteraceae bacterium]|jgi:two-component system, LytTR family, response regulator|nr:response regulator transcription factor [Flavobacteriales bacterium]MDB9701123.1 LytTR family DNA-binding domain-containing protein [Salibacteraceae bacterium]